MKIVVVLAWLIGCSVHAAPPPPPGLFECMNKTDAVVQNLVLAQVPKGQIDQYRTSTESRGTGVRVWVNIITKEGQMGPGGPGFPGNGSARTSATHFVGYVDFDVPSCTVKGGLRLTIVLPTTIQ